MQNKSYGLFQEELDSIIGNIRGLQRHTQEIADKMIQVENMKAMPIDGILWGPLREFIQEKFGNSLDKTKEGYEEEFQKFLKRKDVKILVEFFEYLKKRQNI